MAMPSGASLTVTPAIAALESAAIDDGVVGNLIDSEAALCLPPKVTLTEASRRMLSHLAGVKAATVEDMPNGVLTNLDVVRSLATKGWMSSFTQVKKVATMHPKMVCVDDKTVIVLSTMLQERLEFVPAMMESGSTGVLGIARCLLDVIRRRDMQVNGVNLQEVTLASVVPIDITPSFLTEGDSVASAAAAITKAKRAAVIVLRKGNVVGVVEAKDLMRRVFVDGLDIKAATVADVMSSDPETIASNKSVTLALEEMSAKDCCHVVVKASEKMAVVHIWDIVNALVGTTSMEDLIKKMMSSKEKVEEKKDTTAAGYGDRSFLISEEEEKKDEEEKEGEKEEEENGEKKEAPEGCAEKGEHTEAPEGYADENDDKGEKKEEEPPEGCAEKGEDEEAPEGYAEENEDKGEKGEEAPEVCVEEETLILTSNRTLGEAAIEMGAITRANPAITTSRCIAVGVLTNRTLSRGVIAAERSPGDTSIGDVMTPLPAKPTPMPARESSGVEASSGPKALSGSRRRLLIGLGLAALAGIGAAFLVRRGRR